MLLSTTEVQVWQSYLDVSSERIQELTMLLSEDERERADRFYQKTDRDAFVAARGILRILLGRYLDRDPAQLKLSYSDRGKPFLEGNSLQFNVSHSHGLALYAFARDRAVGIDLEYIREIEVESLAQRFFSDREFRQIQSLTPPLQTATFFRYWTAKEAYLKATGEGLAGLSGIEIEERNSTELALVGEEIDRWHLQPIDSAPNYAATLVACGRNWTWQHQEFSFQRKS
jgi:4'-phosphopantetheinyl transferase